MENERQEVNTIRNKDKLLEAQISLSKGWWRARSKSEMKAGFQRLANLIAKRSPQQIRELEIERFGYWL